ncbi:MAG TPA: heme peroxidase family protein [Solirubrobacteraceae bacterium]|nr:heme peroxidase family protein [Solirubrobacteraceae bacterium]
MPRGLRPAGAGPFARGRFGRMFGFLPVRGLSDAAMNELLARISDSESGDNVDIPAGYTYLGQFIDHDITFDPTSQLQKVNDPYALADFRTPRLDLDSLYGAGADDQPFLYEWTSRRDRGVKLLVGRNPPDDRNAIADLPRNVQGRALLGDPRNDENLILAQLHLLFIRFHNKVVDHVREQARRRGDEDRLRGAELLHEAQRIVRWHYQWIVAHDFLPKIVGDVAGSMLTGDAGSPVRRRFYRWRNEPFIPVEFSGAAFRFGHSIVRNGYKISSSEEAEIAIFVRDADPDGLDHLGGFRRLPPELKISWRRFFQLPGHPAPQPSSRIDSAIAFGLSDLPPEVNEEPVLARLNMRRARALELPAGRDVAMAMGEPPLTAAQLRFDRSPAHLREELMRTAPLWYYVLREAKELHGGKHLGPVGGRIVAEVLLGLIEGDPNSYLRQQPTWQPELAREGSGFTMGDLVRFAEDTVGDDGA